HSHIHFRTSSSRPCFAAILLAISTPAIRQPARLLHRNVSSDPTDTPGRCPRPMSSNPLRDRFVEVIRREGPLPFSRYMQMCLYEPGLGYYARPREQFGKAGDFYTSSDVHAVFGRLLCRQFEEMWRVLGSPKQIDLV